MSKEMANAEFFGRFQTAYNLANPVRHISGEPSIDNWIQVRKVGFPGNSAYHVGFTDDDRFRIELTFQNSKREVNKDVFDFLARNRVQIESDLGNTLEWDRLGLRKRSQVSWYYPARASVLDDDQSTTQYIDWAIANLPVFQEILDRSLSRYGSVVTR